MDFELMIEWAVTFIALGITIFLVLKIARFWLFLNHAQNSEFFQAKPSFER